MNEAVESGGRACQGGKTMLEDEKDGPRLVAAETVELLPQECVPMADVDASSDGGFGHDTLADILYARAALDPDRDAFIFLNYGGGEKTEERLTYANLLARAKAAAPALQAHGKRGDRVLILCPPGPDYIVGFFGTVLAGMVAVPAYPPRNAKHMDRLRAIVADAEAAAVLAPEALHDRLTDWAGGSEALPPLVAADRFTADAGAIFRDAGVKPDDLAFLQYTSGTTGAPKGVMVSHAQVVANLERICDLIAPRRTDTGCCWLPPYHDMGLIGGILFPVMAGLPIVLMPPAAFLQRPLRWLEAMSEYRATITAAPNFGWQLCADAADEEAIARLDLTALRCALSGAEKVRYETMEAFARKFAPQGFRRESIIPVYGMAETVLLATGMPQQTPAPALLLDPVALSAGRVNILDRRVAGEAQPVRSGEGSAVTAGHLAVSCGRVIAGHDLRIIDPETRAECAGDAIGEIWLSGSSLATGYWGRPAETTATFKARPSGVSDGSCYLRTGDLGAVIDGNLYVLGRIKEMIIVRGRNHYAQDLEETAASADPLLGHDRTVAFAIEGRSAEQLVLVHELTRSALRAFDAPAVAAAMREAVVQVHEIAVAAIVFVKPASLPRTTSGKLQRGRARQLFQAGELAEVAHWERPAAGEAMTVTVEPPRAASSPAGEANRLGASPARILRHVDPQIAAATSRARADRMIAWLRAYAEDHINSRLIDERRTIPPYIVLDFARQGLMGPQIGLEHGGAALTFGDTLRLIEQLAAIDLSLALFVGLNHVLGTEPIREGGRAALCDRILPEIASGSSVAAFAVTEPGAGSNPRGMQAVAIPDGPGRWRLFGEKWWSGNASWANYISVFCKLQDEKGRVTGTAGFLVERGMPGLRQGPEALTMGMRGMVQNSIFLEGVSVGRDRMLGQEGDGLSLALTCMRLGRLGIAAMCLGAMARSAQLMTRYAGRRVVGSGNLLDNPVTRERISRIVSERLALACLVEHVGGRIDAGAPVAEDLFHAAKVAAPEFLWQAADDLVQMFGGRGYIETNGTPQLLRDARALRVFEGPTETVASYLGFRVLSDEGDLIAALRQIRPEDGGALPALIALREEVRTRVDILSATNRSDLFLPMGEAATFALLSVLLDRRIADLEATAEMALREALARARMHMWTRFEAARRKVSIRGPEAASIDRAALTELVAGLSARIGDVEQNLAGETHNLDPLLRRDWDREAPDNVTVARQKGVPAQLVKRLGRRVTEDAMIVDTIRSHVAAVVGAPPEAVEVDMDLTSLGIDSLAGAQLIDRLNRSFNVSLDASELYDYPTVRALASMLGADDDIVEEDCTPVAPKLALPTYPFQGQRYGGEIRKRRRAADAHPLLAERHTSARGEVTFESELSIEDQPWLSDHRVFERLVAPGALYGALATAAWAELGGMGSLAVSQVQLHAPLILEAEAGRMLQIVLPAPEDAGGVVRSFEVYSRGPDEEGWTLHAAGRIAGDAGGSPGNLDLGNLQRRLAPRDVANIYDAFADTGARFGPAFRVVSALWVAPGQALGEVVLAVLSSKGLPLHPTLLDGCFQVLAAALPEAELEGASYLPFGWERLWLAGPLPERVWCHGRLREAGVARAETRLGDLVLCDGEGRVLGGVDGITWKLATRDPLLAGTQRFADWLYEMLWREQPFAGGLLPAAFPQEPATLAASAPTAADLFRSEGLELGEIEAFLLDLERLARSYVVKAFDALGWRRKRGEQVDIEALRQRLGVVSPRRRLFARLVALLNEAGVLAALNSKDGARCWRVAVGVNDVLPDAALSDPEALKADLLAHYTFGRIELELLGRCGAALCDVLRGRADPLALLFAEEGASAADLGQALQAILGRAIPLDPTAALFDLGADSLMAIELVNRLAAATGKAIPVRTLFEHPTVAGLVRVLEVAVGQGRDPIAPVGRDGPLPLSFAQQRLCAPDLRSLIEGDPPKRRTTAADILEDAHSADDMRPSDGRTSAGDFLVTGATGMLGTRVVQELLRRTSGKVYCLVRERSERLFSALRDLGVSTSLFGDRLIAVSSDLSRGHFDIDDDCYRALAATIGTVVHCAADIDFVKPYRELRTVNVEAVRAILEFAATGGAKRVLHVSSLGALEAPEKRGRSLRESEPLANPLTLANGYAQSKWAAEAMMVGARKRGFEVIICRAPWLLDHVTQGRADGFIRSFIAGCLQMGHAPDSTMSLNLMPVDFVGKAIAVLASRGATLETVYHLGAERMLAIWELARLIRTPAYEVALEPFEAWTDRAEHRLARDEDFALKRYAPLFRRRDSGGSIITAYLRGDMPSMNSRNTHESLQAMGLTEIPSVDAMCGLIRGIAAAVRGDQAATVVS
jgi:thioester reductase-like protein